MKKGLHKSKSKDLISLNGASQVLLESKSLSMLNKEIQASLPKSKRLRDSSRDSYDSHRIMGRSSLGSI